jgi:hypothetical protein
VSFNGSACASGGRAFAQSIDICFAERSESAFLDARDQLWEEGHETSTQNFSASGSGCCRAAGSFAHRKGADLSARPVRIIVGFPAGGSGDFHARLIDQWLSGRFGQQFVVENWPGAGGNIGTEAVVRAPQTAIRCSWR